MTRVTGWAARLVTAGLALAALAGCGSSAAATSSAGHHDMPGMSLPPAPATVSAPGGRYAGLELTSPYRRPPFTLTDTTGAAYAFGARTAGQPTLLFFGYTHCPDVCPTTLADIAVAVRGLDAAVAEQVQVVFVTTDPARDDPATLRAYLDRFDADLPRPFVGLTGSQAQIDTAQLAAGVPLAENHGQLHSALLLLYGRDDVAHVAFDAGNTPADIAHDLRVVVGS